jgi:hypothetical protein
MNRYFVIHAKRSMSGSNELWERVGRNRARLFIETSSGIARRLARLLNFGVRADRVSEFLGRRKP